MEDSLLWGDTVEVFWSTYDYLVLCSKNGIVFNPKKFVFCK